MSFIAECTRRFLALSIVWLVTAAMALAAADPLQAIPDDALGFAVVNNLSDTSARVQKLTEKMQLPVPELLPMAQLYTGAQQGVDTAGTLAAAFFPSDEEAATWSSMIAVFVPVTDYKAFVAQLQPDDATAEICEVTIMGQQFLATEKGGFAVLAPSDAKDLLQRIKGESKSVAATVQPLRAWLDKQQIGLVLTPAGKKVVLESLRGLLDTAEEAFGQGAAGAAGDDAQVADAVQTLGEMMKAFKELLAASEQELTMLGAGVKIDDATALHASARLAFLPGGGLAKWSANVKLPKGGILAGLPPEKFALVYGAVSPDMHESLSQIFDRLMQSGLSQFGLTKENREEFSALLNKQRANSTATAGMMGQLRPGDSLMSTATSVEHVKDSALHMKLTRDMYALMSKAKVPGADDDKPLYALNDVTIGNLKALELVTDMTAVFKASGQENMPEMLRGIFGSLFGSEGEMRAYIAAADDHTVVMTYSKERLTRAVEHIRSGKTGISADEQIATTEKLLPEGSQWAAYISPQGVLQWVDMVLKQIPELNFNLPPFPASDPIGAAIRVSPEGLDAELVLPESVVAGIGQYVGTIQQLMQGGAPLP